MKIEHIAIWTNNLEELKDFYLKYFEGKTNKKYINSNKNFESYFISFDSGARLEIMKMPDIKEITSKGTCNNGYTHMAFSVGTKERVDELTERINSDGYKIVSLPRKTGDGYYESSVLDPDGNIIEITL